METKIKIKLGAIEVEYEGSETFLKKELPDLIRTVSELQRSASIAMENKGTWEGGAGAGMPEIHLSTNSIAAKLSVSSGPDLAVAAAAHLTFVKNSEVFSRQTLLREMKTASSYFKSSYGSNLSNTLATLIKTKFNEPSSGNYALTAQAKEELRARLA